MDVTKVVGFDLRIPKHFSLHVYDFLQFYMEFTSLLFLKTKEKGNKLLHIGPCSSNWRSLADIGEQRRDFGLVSGEVRPWGRGESWGKERGD